MRRPAELRLGCAGCAASSCCGCIAPAIWFAMPTPIAICAPGAGDAAVADAVLRHALPGADHRLTGGVVLVVAGEVLHVRASWLNF